METQTIGLTLSGTIQKIEEEIEKVKFFVNDYRSNDLMFETMVAPESSTTEEIVAVKPLPVTLIEKLNAINQNLFYLINRYEVTNGTFDYTITGNERAVEEDVEYIYNSSIFECLRALESQLERLNEATKDFHSLTSVMFSSLSDLTGGTQFNASKEKSDAADALHRYYINLVELTAFSAYILEEFIKKLK